jgi:tRNA pseudouridine55 synthase
VETDSLDADGVVVATHDMTGVTVADARRAVAEHLTGAIEQVPPMVSAIKVGGRRLHDLARRGEEVERAPRLVHIDLIDVEAMEPGPFPSATMRVECGSGTYIRTLAADLGAALGGCAHVETLRRLRVGSFGLNESHELVAVEADPPGSMLSPREAMRDLEPLKVDAESVRGVRHGMTFAAGALGEAGDGPFAVIDPDGELLAVYERHGAGVKPAVVVAGDS